MNDKKNRECPILSRFFSYNSQMKRSPINDIEYKEDDGEGNQDSNIHGTSLVFLHRSCQFAKRFDFHLK